MQSRTYDYLFKLLLIGDSDVGKTSLLLRFSDDAYAPSFIPTIGIDFKIKTLVVDGKKIKLQIWDTAGQERFHTITTSYYRGAMGIMLVYDVTNEKTFDNISRWLGYITEHATPGVERIIVGNKCDMVSERQVSKTRGELVAKNHGVKFLEVSAKDNIRVDESFLTLAESILKKNLDEDQKRLECDYPVLVRNSGGRRSLKRMRNNVRNMKVVSCKI